MTTSLADVIKGSPLGGLPRLRHCISRRASSWDRTGGNDDRLHIQAGDTAVLAHIRGAGSINHVWMTLNCDEEHYLRKAVLRMYWDGEALPSVEVPLGDFFGVGHATTRSFASLPLAMSPLDGRALNCFFPMPFSEGARIEVASECSRREIVLYFYVDYELYDELPSGLGRFHSQWRRQNPCDGVMDEGIDNDEFINQGINLSGDGNYVVMEASGQGHYVGCSLNVHNLRDTNEWNWYGEGDDMIFIDGEPFPPSLHGTGTEDYFCSAWSPTEPFSTPYYGLAMAGGDNWSGKISLYRFHIEDPICFRKSIRVTIEHGHANRRSDDWSSTAYWYQTEPHAPFPKLPDVSKRLPRP